MGQIREGSPRDPGVGFLIEEFLAGPHYKGKSAQRGRETLQRRSGPAGPAEPERVAAASPCPSPRPVSPCRAPTPGIVQRLPPAAPARRRGDPVSPRYPSPPIAPPAPWSPRWPAPPRLRLPASRAASPPAYLAGRGAAWCTGRPRPAAPALSASRAPGSPPLFVSPPSRAPSCCSPRTANTSRPYAPPGPSAACCTVFPCPPPPVLICRPAPPPPLPPSPDIPPPPPTARLEGREDKDARVPHRPPPPPEPGYTRRGGWADAPGVRVLRDPRSTLIPGRAPDLPDREPLGSGLRAGRTGDSEAPSRPHAAPGPALPPGVLLILGGLGGAAAYLALLGPVSGVREGGPRLEALGE
nr:vegetative cell wall protein gp1-like [Camelus dromedarius]